MPKSKLAKIGVWEDGRFIGVVIYGVGATPELCKPYKLANTEVCELVRVALSNHKTAVSRILSVSLKILKRDMPGIRLVVSFADTNQGHHGGIYQASGWIYNGDSIGRSIVTNGVAEHPRTLGLRYGVGGQSLPWLKKNVDPNAKIVDAPPKHRYLMPLDDEMRKRIAPLAKPYPKRTRAGSDTLDTPANHAGKGGSIPTPALHTPQNEGNLVLS
jgi:hypothetical protein